jgi:alkylation response protein AidB-like acyl-CoA dehydrogenase
MARPEVRDQINSFADAVDRCLAKRKILGRLRANVARNERDHEDRALWREEAGMGVPAVMVSENLGGVGFGTSAMGQLAEIYGRHMSGGVFLSTACLALPVLVRSHGEARDEVIRDVVVGNAIVSVAFPTSAQIAKGELPFSASCMQSGYWRVSGRSAPIVDGDIADFIVAPASSPTGEVWFLVSRRHFTRERAGVTMDGGGAAIIALDCELPSEARLCTPGEGAVLAEAVLVQGAALISAWLLGLAEKAFDMTLSHLKTRKQFGVHIGSFQALQHRMAALYCDLAVARSVVERACQAIDESDVRSPLFASAAKARMGALAYKVTNEAIQMHGAIGLTEEADISFYLKGARLADLMAGHHYCHGNRARILLLGAAGAEL